MNSESIKDYLLGNFSKKELLNRVLPILLISFFSFFITSYLLFPTELEYDIFKNSISNLGSKEASPIGWIFLSISMMCWGVQLFPIFLYMHKRFSKICKHAARIGTFFGLLGCIFLVLIGIYTDDHVDLY